MKYCDICDGRATRVLYYGLPHWLCDFEDCLHVFGFFSCFTDALPFNGHFLSYDGSYWSALWYWLTGGDDD